MARFFSLKILFLLFLGFCSKAVLAQATPKSHSDDSTWVLSMEDYSHFVLFLDGIVNSHTVDDSRRRLYDYYYFKGKLQSKIGGKQLSCYFKNFDCANLDSFKSLPINEVIGAQTRFKKLLMLLQSMAFQNKNRIEPYYIKISVKSIL